MLKSPCLFLFLFSFFSPDVLHAAGIYLQGRIVSAHDNRPLDSVRVGSILYRGTTFSSSDGNFTLYNVNPVCVPDTQTENRSDTSIVVTGAPRRIALAQAPGGHFQAMLCDLRGRVIGRHNYKLQPHLHLSDFPLIPGVYLLSLSTASGDLRPRKLLIPDKHRSVGLSTSVRVTTTITVSDCPSDTIFFFREGYFPYVHPMSDTSETVLVRLRKKKWISWDIHNHTFLTDGDHTLDDVLDKAFGIGNIDLIANSEHGGGFSSDTAGMPIFPDGSIVYRWRTLKDLSWPKILGQRRRFPTKTIIQGFEWNVPGHEHASVGFIDDNVQPAAISDFEYMFDFNDTDPFVRPSMARKNSYQHQNAIEALKWLQEHFPSSSYCFLNHPCHYSSGTYFVNDLRDFNNAAPSVCIGFEGMPGHQKYTIRGKYLYREPPRNRTYGGADIILAQLGGVWDALLGEGRRFWPVVNSDFHRTSEDFWPGEYAKTWSTATDTSARAWLEGVRTGEMFIVLGDLIDALDFSIGDGVVTASMGSELRTTQRTFRLHIRFRSPLHNNNNDSPRVDHIDLIAGSITGKIDPADSKAYYDSLNTTARVLRRFSKSDWRTEDGWNIIDTELSIMEPTYLRLRGTCHAVGTPGEVDDAGNPLIDGDFNSTALAWTDLWFYSNPIFVYVK